MSTYAPPRVTFVRGEGSYLWDDQGRRYVDFLSGLAVTSLGHAHPAVADAVSEAAQTLLHTSNLFGTLPGREVAETLDRLIGGGGRVFFANSGAEANECAIKLARKWAGHGRYVVLSAYGSFHGRTLATLHATGQPAKHEAFQPLPEGFRHVAWQDLAALENALTPDVAAVLLEPVQGEGGVWPAGEDYFRGVRELCDERGALFMVDEIQTGLGRTGRWWGFQHYGVQPDVVTVAKALGNGVPIGACSGTRRCGGGVRPRGPCVDVRRPASGCLRRSGHSGGDGGARRPRFGRGAGAIPGGKGWLSWLVLVLSGDLACCLRPSWSRAELAKSPPSASTAAWSSTL